MPRPVRISTRQGVPERTFVLDNGAYTLKAGFAPSEPSQDAETLADCNEIPDCIVRTRDRKTYIAARCEEITQWGEAVFRRPVEHGQLVNWEAQKEIWDQSFFEESTAHNSMHIKAPEDTTLILAEATNTMPALQKNADEIVMEEWGFGGYLRTIGASLNAYNDLHPLFESQAALNAHPAMRDCPMECLLVIDSGYSHTVIIPVFEGKPIQRAIRRIELGGKHLTNLLKEVISIRHYDLHQETKIVNDIKEDICFVSQDLKRDLDRTWKGTRASQRPVVQVDEEAMNIDGHSVHDIKVDYILPDGIRLMRGFSRPHDPSTTAARKRKLNVLSSDSSEISMTLGNERFTIPEILFSPTDIGSQQPGLVDCILQSMSVLPPLVQATMLANILVTGGNALIPGLVDRLQNDLRAQVKTDWAVRVRKSEDPIKSTWLGGARLASRYPNVVREYAITKEEYLEHGSTWIARKFIQGDKLER